MNFENFNLSNKVELLIKDFQIYKMHEVVIFYMSLYHINPYASERLPNPKAPNKTPTKNMDFANDIRNRSSHTIFIFKESHI